jgi:L-2,4-diaminobutyrate decarboxylase
MTRYHELLERLRQAFPAPTSDPVHDGYVVFSLLRALDQVDALKSQAPILGRPREPDYEAAARSRLAAGPQTLEGVIPQLVACLEGSLVTSHPRSQINVVAHPSIAGVIGVTLPAIYNPNLVSDESGRGFSEAEVRTVSIVADLLGYDPQTAGGLFTFGGTATILYGVKIGLEKALPGTLENGLEAGKAVVICSQQSHYACASVAAWLGLGMANVVRVATHADNAINLEALESEIRRVSSEGKRIAAIVATLGTTDAFGLDDLAGIHALRERLVAEGVLDYYPHLHADAVIGWAWSVFRDYDFERNPLGFRGRTVRALAAARQRIGPLALADSVGIDFHKTGFSPYISSLFLVRQRADFGLISRRRESMPYLYHSGEYHPGLFSLETSRSASGVLAALGNLLLLGREGFQTLIGHAVEMAEILREEIVARPELTIANDQNFGPVTLFRAYPRGVDTFAVQRRERSDPAYRDTLRLHNAFNRRIYDKIHAAALQGSGVALGFTDNCRPAEHGEPIAALKSYVLSPYVTAERMREVVPEVLAARKAVENEMFAK